MSESVRADEQALADVRVLIVDDHPLFREGLKTLLTALEPAVRISDAGTVAQAIALAAVDAPDLILLDLLMPVMNGWQFREAQASDPALSRIPVVVVTAAGAREDIERLVASLPKPLYTDDELFAQPWHATGGRYPAVMLDHVYYDTAYPRGLVGSGVEGLFRDRYFAAALLPSSVNTRSSNELLSWMLLLLPA